MEAAEDETASLQVVLGGVAALAVCFVFLLVASAPFPADWQGS